MKKNLFYLFALICSMSLFTACSDDDDNSNWKQIPTGPIEGSDATLTLNGNTTTGSVKFTPQSATQGQVEFNNVFPGYSTVTVNVAMEEQTDGSFTFSGEQGLSAPAMLSTRMTATAPAIMNVTVNGNITLAGKVSVTATSALSETAMGGLNGTWKLLDKIDTDVYMTEINAAPFILKWPAIDEDKLNGESIARLGSVVVSHILSEVLNQVTFNSDGNITAKFHSGLPFNGETAQSWIMSKIFSTDISVSHEEWADSPKNMAFWYVRDNKLYIVPLIDNIMGQVSGGSGTGDFDLAAIMQMLSQWGIDITKLDPALITQITGWLSGGIPLSYRTTDAGLDVYVDKDMVATFMPIVFAALPTLQEKFDELVATNPLMNLLLNMLGIQKLTDIETIWNENTASFELGLEFTK